MAHEEHQLTKEQIREWADVFDWSKREKHKVEVTSLITTDDRLARYFESIKEWTSRIQREHGTPLDKMEVIIAQWLWDENFSSVLMRWTSKRGIFQREVAVGCADEKYVLDSDLEIIRP